MKRTAIYLLALAALLTACNRFDNDGYSFDNSIYLDVSSMKTAQAATFGNNIPEVTKTLTPTLAYPSDNEITATVTLDASLVARYNEEHGTGYELLPQQYCDFTSASVTIPAGKIASETVELTFKGLMGEGEQQTGALEIDRTYLFPVRITADNIEVMEASSVAYYLVKRSSAITTAAQLTDNWISFPQLDVAGDLADLYNGIESVTYEALIYIDRFDLTNDFGECNISTVMGVEDYILMRIGDAGFERQQIQFNGLGASFGKFPKTDARKKLYEGQWYHVATTYDSGNNIVRIYVNGKIQSEGKDLATLPEGGLNFAMRALPGATGEERQFFIGYSYNDYRPLQGKIAEARVWTVARTPEQIWDNMYRIADPEQHPELIGYWKFNEGKGNTVKDHSLYGNDGIAHTDLVWADGIEIPEINK